MIRSEGLGEPESNIIHPFPYSCHWSGFLAAVLGSFRGKPSEQELQSVPRGSSSARSPIGRPAIQETGVRITWKGRAENHVTREMAALAETEAGGAAEEAFLTFYTEVRWTRAVSLGRLAFLLAPGLSNLTLRRLRD